MKRSAVLGMLVLVSASQSVELKAGELSSFSYLKKLSMHLRGKAPEAGEYAALARAIRRSVEVPGSDTRFLNDQISEYLAGQEHVNRMAVRMDELFRMRTPAVPPHRADPDSEQLYPHFNTMNALFRSVVRENRRWDELLTGKSYVVHPHAQSQRYVNLPTDIGFFGLIAPDRVPPAASGVLRTLNPAPFTEPLELTFEDDDPRVAGAVTTARFFRRYTNTVLNKNRRRAAAMFSTFLCDDMKAVIPDQSEKTEEYLRLAFPEHADFTEEELLTLDHPERRHGNQPDCMSCHYKLDPMGKAFQLSGVVLSRYPSPGALVYRRKDGTLVNEPGRGIGDLARSITRQREYVECQVRHFWRWYVGKDRPLADERLAELVEQFESSERRPNTFVSYLVAQPEFRERVTETRERTLARKSREILTNCVSCHRRHDIPDFNVWPIGGSKESMGEWIAEISDRLDLENDGARRTMPPRRSVWQPTPEELRTLKDWIGLGAPDHSGEPQLPVNDSGSETEGRVK